MTSIGHSQTTTRQETATPSFNLMKRQRLWGWVFISPWIIGFLAFFLIPIAASFVFTFMSFDLTNPENTRWIGFANYSKLLSDPLVGTSLSVTFRFMALSLPLSILVPLGIAALMNHPKLQGKRFFRTLFYMPYIVPIVSAVYIWNGYLNTEAGWLNRLLEIFGIKGPNWLFDVNWIYPALILIGLWGVGNAMLTMLASMQGVPTELYEAARVDGAGAFTIFRKITIPMISPVILYNLVISLVGLFRYFDVPYILKKGQGDPGNATMFYNIHFYKTAFRFQDMGYGATLAWFLLVIALIATLIVFATARHWVYYAAGDNN
jgi:ABC-type sugar transport system permease subunit